MKQFQNILFNDIETTPKVKHFADLDPRGQELFKKKFQNKADLMIGPDDP